MKTRKKLFIHIGAMKTGSSAIQSTFYKQKEWLNAKGFAIPSIQLEAKNFLAFSLLDQKPAYIHHSIARTSGQLYANLVQDIEKSTWPHHIISSEVFYQLSIPQFLGSSVAKKVKAFLSGIADTTDIIIIFFVRRQDRLIESIYNQVIKSHHVYHFETRTFSDFVTEYRSYCDFESILTHWETEFGRQNLRVLPYIEGETDSKQVFYRALGVHGDFESDDKTDNPSLNTWETEFVRRLNYNPLVRATYLENEFFINLVKSISPVRSSQYQYFSEKDRSVFLQSFEEANKRLTVTYMNGEANWYQQPLKQMTVPSVDITEDDYMRFISRLWTESKSKNGR